MQEKLLLKIKQILVNYARQNKLVEYNRLSKELGGIISPIKLNEPLGEISLRCIKSGFPPLSVLVVNQQTQIPGEGFFTWVASSMGYSDLPISKWEEFFEEKKAEVFKEDNWDAFLSQYDQSKKGETKNSFAQSDITVSNKNLNTWIFQGNPKHFRIDDFLRENKYILWSLNQAHYQSVILTGDIVYFWRADGGRKGTGGVIAKGKVIGAPQMNADPSPYWINSDGNEKKLRVPIEIVEELIDGPYIRRTEIIDHQLLNNLSILRMANNTNYLVSSDHVNELHDMWHSRLSPLSMEINNKVFSEESYQDSLQNKTYAKGRETKYYILTVKKFLENKDLGPFQYNVLLMEGHQVVKDEVIEDETSKQLLTLAKIKGVELLFMLNPLISLENTSMVHYSQDRLKDDLWKKEPTNSLKELFVKLEKTRLLYIVKNDVAADNSQYTSYYKDGEITEYYGNRFERKAKNRLRAIEHHGTSCVVCGINFEEVYGEHGKDFIEVHHIKPLSTLDAAMVIDPVNDLIPVCPNCHRMLHRKRENVLSVDELRQIIKN